MASKSWVCEEIKLCNLSWVGCKWSPVVNYKRRLRTTIGGRMVCEIIFLISSQDVATKVKEGYLYMSAGHWLWNLTKTIGLNRRTVRPYFPHIIKWLKTQLQRSETIRLYMRAGHQHSNLTDQNIAKLYITISPFLIVSSCCNSIARDIQSILTTSKWCYLFH